MANKIIISWLETDPDFVEAFTKIQAQPKHIIDKNSSTKITLIEQDVLEIVATFPMTEEMQMNITTAYKSVSNAISEISGSFSSAIETFSKFQSGVAGQQSKLLSYLDFQMWDKTDPLSFDIPIVFRTRNNPIFDVLLPTMSICGLNALTKAKDGTYRLPGVSLATFADFASSNNSSSINVESLTNESSNFNYKNKNAKLASFEIPGLLDLDKVVINATRPKFSNQITASGSPLNSSVDLTISTVYPANSSMLASGLKKLTGKAPSTQQVVDSVFSRSVL